MADVMKYDGKHVKAKQLVAAGLMEPAPDAAAHAAKAAADEAAAKAAAHAKK